ncbi:hypothetical protein FDECE_11374 [Fusarium decemcellulare]|nr:hypothetical protein FDECE_11374 [Fusarium decemcellulare]
MNLIRKKPVPDYVPGDQVIPVHYFDDTIVFRSVVVYTLLSFNDVLDPERLRTSLSTLVKREGWKKLGGRLRRGKDGLEYHVPETFDDSRPPIAFTHIHHDILSADHPSASRVPQPDEHMTRPAIVGDPEELSELVYPPDRPNSLEDWLTSDRPTLGLHVTSFQNKTMVVLYWPHLAMDALGQKAVFEGWTMVLEGRDDEIAAPVGYDSDPFAEVGKHPTEPHKLAPIRMNTVSMVGYGLRNIVGLGLSAREIRMLCIPAVSWQKWYDDARKELGPDQFLTEGDIITAFWIRLSVSHLSPKSNTTVTVNMAMSLRKVLEKETLPKGRPYISNALGFANVILPAKDILTKPLSWLAQQVRLAIAEQGTRGQVEAYLALQRESAGRLLVFFGDVGMHQQSLSNWQKANMFGLDFKAAAVTSRDGKPLRPEYIQNNQSPVFPEGFPIIGKDEKGNYWLSGYRRKGLWVITGAGGGLGSGLSRQLALLGMTIIIADNAMERAEQVASDIQATGGQAEAIAVDVSVPEELDRLADHVFARYGSVRILINNAGIETLGTCWEVSTARWEATLNVNLHGVVHGVRAFLPRMIASGDECWVSNTSSSGAFATIPGQSAYIITKHAVQAFTEALYVELKSKNVPIHVSSIIPGLLNTGIFNGQEDGNSANQVSREHRKRMAEMAKTQGMDVDEASKIIVEQIAEGRFWISTHPDITKDFLERRVRFYQNQEDPSSPPGIGDN